MIGMGTTIFLVNPATFPSATSYLLDTYSAAAAYSLRQLKTGVTNVVRVRRSSDSAESDFTATEITDGTLTTWTGANDGFVVTWYEQTGGGTDLTESTAANQPKIVSSGSLVTDGGKPALFFDGTNDQFTITGNSNWDLANNLTLIGVASQPDAAGVSVTFSQRYNATEGWWVVADSSTGKQFLTYNDGGLDDQLNLSAQQNTTAQRLMFFTSATGTLNGYYNGTQQETGLTATTTWATGAKFSVGRLGTQSLWYKSYQQEIIIFESDESSNRTDIESDINTYYSIY